MATPSRWRWTIRPVSPSVEYTFEKGILIPEGSVRNWVARATPCESRGANWKLSAVGPIVALPRVKASQSTEKSGAGPPNTLPARKRKIPNEVGADQNRGEPELPPIELQLE